MTSKEALVKYLHQCSFVPANKTSLKAVKHKQLTTCTGLTVVAVQNHLHNLSPATNKGHMKQKRKGIRSTTKIKDTHSQKENIKAAIENIEKKRGISPPKAFEIRNQMLCYWGLMNKRDGTIYADFTGKLLIISMDGMVGIFIVYDRTTNAILSAPVKNMK